ncbi:MAG: hypothetical protein Q9215_005720 [Flavoplaca cf. flavocitrina]
MSPFRGLLVDGEKYVGEPAKILEALDEKEKRKERVKEGTIDYQQHDPFSRSTYKSQTSHLPFRIKDIELCCFPINAVFSSKLSYIFSLTTTYLYHHQFQAHCCYESIVTHNIVSLLSAAITQSAIPSDSSFEGHPLKMKFSTIPTVLLTVLAASAKAQVF